MIIKADRKEQKKKKLERLQTFATVLYQEWASS